MTGGGADLPAAERAGQSSSGACPMCCVYETWHAASIALDLPPPLGGGGCARGHRASPPPVRRTPSPRPRVPPCSRASRVRSLRSPLRALDPRSARREAVPGDGRTDASGGAPGTGWPPSISRTLGWSPGPPRLRWEWTRRPPVATSCRRSQVSSSYLSAVLPFSVALGRPRTALYPPSPLHGLLLRAGGPATWGQGRWRAVGTVPPALLARDTLLPPDRLRELCGSPCPAGGVPARRAGGGLNRPSHASTTGPTWTTTGPPSVKAWG
jgi:hypothetical protein